MPIAKRERARVIKLFGSAESQGDQARAAGFYWDAWNEAWALIQRENITSVDAAERKLDRDLLNWALEAQEALGAVGRHEDQIAICNALLHLTWDEDYASELMDVRLELVKAQRATGREDEAEALLAESLRTDPDCVELWLEYLPILEARSDDRLLSLLHQVEARFRESDDAGLPDLYGYMGEAYARAGEEERARACMALKEDAEEEIRRIVDRTMERLAKNLGIDNTNQRKLEQEGYIVSEKNTFFRGATPSDDAEARGKLIADRLTEENFADDQTHVIWSKLPEDIRASLLVDFRCLDCLVREALGISSEEIGQMNEEELNAAVKRALSVVSEEDIPRVALNNIRIAFEVCDMPSNMEGKKTIMIHGQCARCGCDIRRAFIGERAPFAMAMASLAAAGLPHKSKPGRNDPCPCGSGKKFKKCCGKH